MKTSAISCVAVFAAAQITAAVAANESSMRPALGTSAAVDSKGQLWVAYAQSAGNVAHVIVQRSDDAGASWQAAVRVNATAEPVAAEGENRPKIAPGPGKELYVTW